MSEVTNNSVERVKAYFLALQDSICDSLSALDTAPFVEDAWQYEDKEGGGRTRVLADGEVIEKGGVLFSHIHGDKMPAAATAKRPELAGKSFQAMGVSLVVHPRNPHAPTSHMNVRFFIAGAETDSPVWWFGGGFDLTPYYGYQEDAAHWHSVAAKACSPFGDTIYQEFKKHCDEYFYLPHRKEARGIGGLFFDDLNEPDFELCFELMQSVGNHYIPAIVPILNKRKDQAYSDEQRQWQLVRRGRYVEFNLVFDRGTLFGLQSGGRTESILMSMPPLAAWAYRVEPEQGTAERELLDYYLVARNWLA